MKEYDREIQLLADYVCDYKIESQEAYDNAKASFLDAIGCAILALRFKECTKLLGPIIHGTTVPEGSRVPGTRFILDPIRAAFNIGTMIRWLDYNDTWLGAEWGHPSDSLGGILAVADWKNLTFEDLYTAQIKAYEIQGILALENSFNQIGFDHVVLVKVATAAVVTKLLGGTKEQVCAAISQGWIDIGPLRTYRHAPNTGSRKSWAAGDATSRGVQLAWMTLQGEKGYHTALTAPKWGLYDVLFQGKPFSFQRPLGSYVIENILYKISFPAEFHAQTAVEAAIKLYPHVKDKWEHIEKIKIETHDSAIRIIDKKGPLRNPADRDHCIQYMTAIGLLHGTLTAEHYEEEASKNPLIDRLREKMEVVENKKYSEEYHHPDKRSIANCVTIYMKNGRQLGPIEIEYPIGHRKRRTEAMPLLIEKFKKNIGSHTSFQRAAVGDITSQGAAEGVVDILFKSCANSASVHSFLGLLVP